MAEDSKVVAPRTISGSPIFVAATRIDEERSDLSFADALALARLVLEHDGGPVPARGKRALMDAATVRRLTKLDLLQMDEGFGREVGSRSTPGMKVSASEGGVALVAAYLTQQPGSEPPDAAKGTATDDPAGEGHHGLGI